MPSVKIAELKARLSEYLRIVRGGDVLTVLDRETPIARIVPYSAGVGLTVRHPSPGAPALHKVRLPPPLRTGIDIVALLLEERQGNR
jgi:prevent-host-death family protein